MDKGTLTIFAAIAGLLGCYGCSSAPRSPSDYADPHAETHAKSLPFLVLGVAQRYAAGPLADFALFNLVESWSGSDPTRLKRNMKEIQPVKWNGKVYFLVATPNRLDIGSSMEGGGADASLWFDPGTLAWYAEAGAEKVKLAEWKDSSRHVLMLIHPNGSKVAVRP
jgi:hypothetical protein